MDTNPSVSRDLDPSLHEEDSEPSGSDHGSPSITGSVEFPIFNPVVRPVGEALTYCLTQMASGNGFPPRAIRGDIQRPQKHLQRGVGIGDVGYLDDFGAFSYMFNIFHPSDDPIHVLAPREFKPITPPLEKWEVTQTESHFEPWTVLCSEGVSSTLLSESPRKYSFTSSARDGSVIILPEGADRDELVDITRLHTYVSEHAIDWYRFFNGYSVDDDYLVNCFMNGTVYVITGVDRTHKWATLSFPRGEKSRATYRFACQEGDADHFWTTDAEVFVVDQCLEGPRTEHPMAVFYRGLSISLGPQVWKENFPLALRKETPNLFIPSIAPLGIQAAITTALEQTFHFTRYESIHRAPKIPFHPSILLTEILLKLEPTAQFAIVHDSTWTDLIKGRNPTLHVMRQIVNEILNKYDAVMAEGIVTFRLRETPKEDPPIDIPSLLEYIKAQFGPKPPEEQAKREIRQVLTGPGRTWFHLPC